ncbi:hypothetical protein JSO19_09565 [Leucobacter sp. UCMA 4100]|uniref:hypothetical protein n=1 Tax=Leucobacter TaxID=55968 RepID=UPI001C246394|nr:MULTISPECIES: hypothetical protein [Leucobacter]MDA3147622.1 hypothetical protein [Leucobacter sp. UCMA 4100]
MLARYFALAQFLCVSGTVTGAVTVGTEMQPASVQLFVLIVLGIPALTLMLRWISLAHKRFYGFRGVPSSRAAALTPARSWRVSSDPGIRGAVRVRAPAIAGHAHA